MGNQKEMPGNGNGTITVTKGRWVIGGGVVGVVLYVLLTFASPRATSNQPTAPAPKPDNTKAEKVEQRVRELEKIGAATVEHLKHIDKKLDEISAKLDK